MIVLNMPVDKGAQIKSTHCTRKDGIAHGIVVRKLVLHLVFERRRSGDKTMAKFPWRRLVLCAHIFLAELRSASVIQLDHSRQLTAFISGKSLRTRAEHSRDSISAAAISCPNRLRSAITARVHRVGFPSLLSWHPSIVLAQPAFGYNSWRSRSTTTRMALGPLAVEDPAQLNVKVRLILLRSKLVEWYEGPDMALQDLEAILTQFEAFAKVDPRFSFVSSNYTQGSGGVFTLFKSGLDSNYDVEISLLGLDDYQRMITMRDASAPNEPYMQLK